MEEIEKEFKAFFCKTMSETKEPLLDVITILYLEPEEISLEEIANKTGYSLASISNTMKILENLNMVNRIKKPGTKKVYFFMEKELAKINMEKLKFISMHIHEIITKMPVLLAKYSKSKDEKIKRKYKIMEKYYKQIIELDSIINKWKNDLERMMMKWQKQ